MKTIFNKNVIFLKKSGLLNHFYIDEWQFVNKYQHNCGIKKIYAEPYGMSIAFIDEKSEGYIYNPVNFNVINIPNMSSNTIGIVWEAFEPEKWVFVTYDGDSVSTYIYSKYTVEGIFLILINYLNK